jgi:hypothetical protein
MKNTINSVIAVAATLAGLATSAVLQDLRAQTVEPVVMAVAEQTARLLPTRSFGVLLVRMPPVPDRAGLPVR